MWDSTILLFSYLLLLDVGFLGFAGLEGGVGGSRQHL